MTTENTISNENPSDNQTRFPKWLIVAVVLLGLATVCFIGVIVALWNSLTFEKGGYSIERVVLTDQFDETGNPIGNLDVFRPSQRINCVVDTTGVEGIIGMRWYHGDELLFEHFGKTQNNRISTYIESNDKNFAVLPDGDYRVDIHIVTDGEPLRTVKFAVKRYQPEVVPPQPVPTAHQALDPSPFVEVPFAFDEVWSIDDQNWPVNEVKVVFLEDGTTFINVVTETEVDVTTLSEEELRQLARPIALYAVRNGYLDKARALKIDGKSYPLDEIMFVSLVNPGKARYRANFSLEELAEPVS